MNQEDKTKLLAQTMNNIKELTERQKLVIGLHHLDRLSFEQIGDVLKVSPDKAEIVYMKAIRRLEQLLREHHPELLGEMLAKTA